MTVNSSRLVSVMPHWLYPWGVAVSVLAVTGNTHLIPEPGSNLSLLS